MSDPGYRIPRRRGSGFGAMAQGLAGGIQQFGENRRQSEQNRLQNALRLAELDQSGYSVSGNQLMRTGGDQVPEGFVRVGGKTVQDPTYYNPAREREKAAIKAEEEARAMSRFGQMAGWGGMDQSSDLEDEIASLRAELENLEDDDDTEVAMTDPMESYAREAIAAGADPAQVMAELQKLRGR